MPSAMPSAQPSPGGKDNPTDPSAFPSAQPGTNTQPNVNGNNQGGQNGAGNSGFPSGSGSFSGGFSSGGSTFSDIEPEEDEDPVYAVAEIAVYSISSRNKVDVTIAIDELDITRIYLGQTCEVTFDAINAKTYEGTVTKISSTGENSGGNTKYTVIVTMDREEDMLSGMNTHITFTTETKEGIKVVPESAIIEKDDKTYVYTAYDKETDELGGLKEVTLGLADGDNVEVLSGLDSGDMVYYRYADTLTYTFIND